MHAKMSLAGIIAGHRRTYVNAATGRRMASDLFAFEALPVLAAGLALGFGVNLPPALAAGLAGLLGLVAVMMFGALLFVGQVSGRLAERSSALELSGRETSERRRFLGELLTNTAYGVAVALGALLVLLLGFGPGEMWRADGLAIGALVHVAFVFGMVMKRLSALGEVQLRDTLR